MREIILRALKGKTSPDINIDNLPGEGKLDVVCGCIANALHISHHMREDTVFYLILDGPPLPPKLVTFYGDKIKDLGFDERGIAKKLINALKKGSSLKLDEEVEAEPGINIAKKSFEKLFKEKAENRKIFYLHKKGKDIREVNFGSNPLFVLGDHTGVPKNTERFLERAGAEKIKLGPVMLFASQCITVLHNELDRRTFGK